MTEIRGGVGHGKENITGCEQRAHGSRG
jgi:hypothetical protein